LDGVLGGFGNLSKGDIASSFGFLFQFITPAGTKSGMKKHSHQINTLSALGLLTLSNV